MKYNKLLAEYVGYVTNYNASERIFDVRDQDGTYINWHPESDWNQLMMVVEKIEEGQYVHVEIKLKGCIITFPSPKDNYGRIRESVEKRWDKSKIEAVYSACVEYIKQKK